MVNWSVLLAILFAFNLHAQENAVLRIAAIPVEGVLLDKGWKYQSGDKPDWAKPDFDDSDWKAIDPTQEILALPQFHNEQIKWLRLDFEVSQQLPQPLGIAINQAGASEIFLNGRLIHRYGHIDSDPAKVKAYDPLEIPIYLPADTAGQYTLAVRYALQPNLRYTNIYNETKNRFFNATLFELVPTLHKQYKFNLYYRGLEIFITGMLAMFFIYHCSLFLFQTRDKTNLILSLYLLVSTLTHVFKLIGENQHEVAYRFYSLNLSNWFLAGIAICLSNVYYRLAKVPFDKYYYAIVIYSIFYALVSSLNNTILPLQSLFLLLGTIFNFTIWVQLIRVGIKKQIKGFPILGLAVLISMFCFAIRVASVLMLNHGVGPIGYNTMPFGISPYWVQIIIQLGSVSVPLGLSLFMGIRSNETNKALSKQLTENEQLKNKAIEIEQEKQHLLATQNEVLEKEVNKRTAELNQSLETIKATQTQLIQSEKLASLGELTAGIAHEIQNPLNFVNNFSELSLDLVKDIKQEINKTEKDEAYIEELFHDLFQNQEKINQHGKRASSIVKGMLEHSRMSTGIKQLTDINKLADEFLKLSFHGFRARDKSFNADFKTNLDESIDKVSIIPQDFGRVLLNLINNAFYAVHEKNKALKQQNKQGNYMPTVTVSTQKAGQQLIVKIEDNGLGMPDSVKAKIFQPFFTTKPSGEGTGLGLSLSYDIITKGHNGTMEVLTEENIGTTFILTIPC